MLKSTSKTVIEIDMLGQGGLSIFVQECYNLPEWWELRDGDNCSMMLFEITTQDEEETFPYFADYNLEDALSIIEQGYGVDWEDVGSVLARLVYDQFIPPGNYLVRDDW